MTRYLWLSVPVCCAAALWSACGPPPNSCQVSADCFPDEVCVKSVCVNNTPVDAGDPSNTGGGDGTTGGGDGTTTGGGDGVTGGGAVAGGGTQTGGGDATGHDAGVDAGMPDCETGDTLPCCSGRGAQTCESDGTWSACDATVSSESCNGVDDDCNGTVDNDVLFSLPDGGVAMNVSCSVGVGACASSGSLACATDGGVVCGAPEIQPTTEICDDIDNDCDGQTDEGTKVLCMIDADNDHYAGSAMQQEFCPDATRPAFGNCPTGYVATSLGPDCNDSDATAFATISVRPDADGDSYCTSATATSACTNGTAPAGFRIASSCNASITDCNDGDATLYQNLPARLDSDSDGSCTGAATTVCSGASVPNGYRSPGTCATEDDCSPADATKYRMASIAPDSDGDRWCTAAGANTCIGPAPTPGYRYSNECLSFTDCNATNASKWRTGNFYTNFDGDAYCNDGTLTSVCYGSETVPQYFSLTCNTVGDCNDLDANLYRNVNLKNDIDGDNYCTGTATPTCIGTLPPAGKQIATSCNATADCNDTNSAATSNCSVTINSNTWIKYCDGGHQASEFGTFNWSCPVGYHANGTSRFIREDSVAQTDVYGGWTVSQTRSGTSTAEVKCRTAAVGSDYWHLEVDCDDNTQYP